MRIFPAEAQKGLLAEHGLYGSFAATWVSIENINDVATRLQVAPEARTTCDFETAMSLYEPSSGMRRVWVNRHAPGWSHILTLSGAMPSAEALSLDNQRAFELACNGEVDEIYPLSYTRDGVSDVDFFEIPEYVPYWDDLESPPFMPTAEELEQHLIIMGRISGRFYDREWFLSEGLLLTVP
ncbi:hypothetical protein ACIBF7_44810 [Nonomuraea sp. NPDC050478]|uniref:hypothetical protein n=1 Tax=Nonomuraea sp. NPDC050478 TaxID=3364365 RepID=UPI0037A9136C